MGVCKGDKKMRYRILLTCSHDKDAVRVIPEIDMNNFFNTLSREIWEFMRGEKSSFVAPYKAYITMSGVHFGVDEVTFCYNIDFDDNNALNRLMRAEVSGGYMV